VIASHPAAAAHPRLRPAEPAPARADTDLRPGPGRRCGRPGRLTAPTGGAGEPAVAGYADPAGAPPQRLHGDMPAPV